MEYFAKAIDRVPSGNDYVIIDRCAGTGNREGLTDELSLHPVYGGIPQEYKVMPGEFWVPKFVMHHSAY